MTIINFVRSMSTFRLKLQDSFMFDEFTCEYFYLKIDISSMPHLMSLLILQGERLP